MSANESEDFVQILSFFESYCFEGRIAFVHCFTVVDGVLLCTICRNYVTDSAYTKSVVCWVLFTHCVKDDTLLEVKQSSYL